MKPELTQAEYETARAICDKADRYAAQFVQKNGWTVIPADAAKHPDYAACSNELRGKVEQFEILRDMPETIFAYIGNPRGNGMGCEGIIGQGYPVQVWTGLQIGNATKGATWQVNSFIGSHMSQFYARIGGREYTGRGFGEGVCIRLKETAQSKRDRGAL